MKNILLINPKTPDFIKHKDKSIPLSLLYLGSVLKKNNHNVKLIDINNKPADITSELKYFKPDLVGITCLFSGRFKSTIALSQKIKKSFPQIPIIIGGIHPTIYAKEILNAYPCIDYVCLGEGENTLVDIVDGKNLKDIDGLTYRQNKRIMINEKTSFIENIDDLPFPSYDLIDLKDYYFNTSGWYNPKKLPINVPVPIVSSRSCPGKCTFCSMFLVHGKKWRPRSAESVVDEIEYLYNKYNHRYFSFMDDNLTLSKKRTMEITDEIIKRNLNIQFDTPNGISINSLDKKVMSNLVKAGLIRVCVAPESGSEFIRNVIMKKNLSTRKIYDFFDVVKNYDQLFVKCFFIIGYPQETEETLRDTYNMIKRISDSIDQIAIFNLVPFPGTEIFEYCKNENLINISLNNLHNSELFSNYNDSDIPFIKPHRLERDDLIRFREETYKLIKSRKVN